MSDRRYPSVRVRHASPNASSRNGIHPRIIVLHSTEGQNVKGLADLIGLGGWFANTGAQVSSHCATDADGQSARYVSDDVKAWHCAGYNSLALGIEQVGRAAQARSSWTEAQLRETSRWIAYWSRKWGIPIQKGVVSNGRILRPGVVTHADLGVLGGGHHDPGEAYPLKVVLTHARRYRRLQSK
jgi:N-acetyl-anhydromuramyl-L-alanine amidase AmpD